jgi:hypothetical protein
MCPDLIEQHRNLLRHNSWVRLIYGPRESNEVSEASNDAAPVRKGSASSTGSMPARESIPPPESYVPDYTPADLLKDPETQELESIVHLLQNCRARIRYESQLRDAGSVVRHEGEGNDDDNDGEAIVTIPPPGVPPSAVASESDVLEASHNA